MEATNLADLDTRKVPEPVELFTVDLSYLSLTSAVPQFESLEIAARALLVALVKPMFELHLDRPPHDEERLARAVQTAVDGIAATGRWRPTGTMRSPLRGARGAVEFFVYAQRLTEPGSAPTHGFHLAR